MGSLSGSHQLKASTCQPWPGSSSWSIRPASMLLVTTVQLPLRTTIQLSPKAVALGMWLRAPPVSQAKLSRR